MRARERTINVFMARHCTERRTRAPANQSAFHDAGDSLIVCTLLQVPHVRLLLANVGILISAAPSSEGVILRSEATKDPRAAFLTMPLAGFSTADSLRFHVLCICAPR